MSGRMLRRLRPALGYSVLYVLVAAAAIAIALWATPMQQVSAAGQTVQVGVAPPSLSLSGPGQLELFGQQLPTTVQFEGPVRPRLVLSRITLSEQLAQLTAQDPQASARSLENALVSGWRRYFVWQLVVVGLAAVVLLGAVAGWLRHGVKGTVKLIAIGLVIAEAIDMGAIMITASSTPDKLRSIHSLHDLVGDSTTPASSLPGDPLPTRAIRKVTVVGDSTAAGQGNRPVPRATKDDKACHRSADSFGEDLARTDTWDVTNLACGGATVQEGLLGPQWVGTRMQDPQLEDPAVTKADVVIVSIGANDVRWADLLRLCAVASSCVNKAAQAFFQQQLADFSRDLLDLMSRLQLLPNHPIVLVNQYYDPFDPDGNCLTQLGMTDKKRRTLEADLGALNTILANAAKTAGFLSVRPDFAGHGICAPQPYVQGIGEKAPFHPNASGQLEIALADDNALHVAPTGDAGS